MKQNRIFHPPSLHVARHGVEKKPSWLELFYDLIYVAAIIQLGNGLSHHVSILGILEFAALFYFLWYTWSNFSFFYNRFNTDDAVQRLLVFTQMFAIGGMAVSVGNVFDGNHHGFIACYLVARLIIVALYARIWFNNGPAQQVGRSHTLIWGGSCCLWLLSLFVPAPWTYGIWVIATLIDFSAPLTRTARDMNARYPSDGGHITERFGLLTIIVLGEMFVKVLSEVSGTEATPAHLLMASLGLGVTCSLWWLYFDDIANSHIKRSPSASLVWLYSHFPMMMAITGVGVAIKKIVFLDPFDIPTLKYRILLCGILCIALASMAVIDMVTERAHAQMRDSGRVNMRWLGAAAIASMIFIGGFMNAWLFMLLVTCICIAQVIADLVLAPESLAHTEHPDAISFGAQTEDHEDDADDGDRIQRRAILESAIRIGTPNAFRSDLYFQLMEGTWSRLFVVIGGMFLFINLIFSGLFLLDPTSISNVTEPNFLDAFSFSIHTFTTIGYGNLTPVGPYADILVAILSFLGIIWVALVTGLVFTKASRPKASVLFSNPAIIRDYHGQRTLMIRLGNARGNIIVSADVKLSVLIDGSSPEGQSIRILRELKLVRSHTPLFAITWTVMHVIDESSPLFGLDEHNLQDHVTMMIANIIGHDETYAATVHARRLYLAEDIYPDHHFSDVLHRNEGEPLTIDFNQFHTVVPSDDTAGSPADTEE